MCHQAYANRIVYIFPRIIWSLDESTSSSVTSHIYFEWKLKGTLNTASQRKSQIHAGAWLSFTDTYFAALTVNITTYVFVFPTTDRVVVWHVEVKSARRCKYSSWAFMLSCQTSSQQQQTDLRAKGGLDVAPLRDCRIWLIISEWWSCHHNRSVSSLYTARATRWNVRTRQWHPLPQCLLVITVIRAYSSANYWKSIYFCKILGYCISYLAQRVTCWRTEAIYLLQENKPEWSFSGFRGQSNWALSCALALSCIPLFGNYKFSQEAIRRLRCTSFISLTTSLSYTRSISTGAMIPLIKSQCDVNWQIRWWHLILGLLRVWDSSNEFYRARLNRVLCLKLKELRVTQQWAVAPIQHGWCHVFTFWWSRGGAVSHVKIGGRGNCSHMLALFLARRALFSPPFNATFLSEGFMKKKTLVTTCSISFKEVHDWLALQ